MNTKLHLSVAAAAALSTIVLLGFGTVACSSGSSGSSETEPSTGELTAGARPSSTAELAIVTPKDGDVFTDSTVPLKVSLTGGKVVATTSTNLQPDEGHLHVLLDNELISMTSGLRENIPDVKPGAHLVRVEFVANDHAPFNPRVIAQTTFEVSK